VSSFKATHRGPVLLPALLAALVAAVPMTATAASPSKVEVATQRQVLQLKALQLKAVQATAHRSKRNHLPPRRLLRGLHPYRAAAANGYTVPTCPHRYRARMRWWSGWYACYRRRARKQWRRATGCRSDYELWRRTRGAKRAWQCKPPTRPDETPPQTNPPQPNPNRDPAPGISNQLLMNQAFEWAKELGNIKMQDTRYLYRGRLIDWWINAYVSNGNVVSPATAPGTYDPSTLRLWGEGCAVERDGVAYCIRADKLFNGSDSSIPGSIENQRWRVTAYLGTDGRVYQNVRSADWPHSTWYYDCFGPPQMGTIPTCS
jgi:hypothetical protein